MDGTRLRAPTRSSDHPSVAWCELVEAVEGGGVFVFSLDACFGDGWALTIEEAKAQAVHQFEIGPAGWHEVLPGDNAT